MKPIVFPRGRVTSAELAPVRDLEPPEPAAPVLEAAGAVQQSRPDLDEVAAPTRIVDVDPLRLESERILAPGALARHGVPYKMLRTQVLRRLDKLGVSSIAVVGTAAETGKTLTAINLAIAIAADPERTALLVDLDLRKPSIHRRFGIEPSVGIDDCLRRTAELNDALVRPRAYERLVILPARERCLDSSELLSTRRTEELIREMRDRYTDRVVVFDLPPLLQADDALAFARHVEAVLVVVGEGRTRRDDLMRTFELLRDVPIVGTVLNGTREPINAYY